MRLFRTPGFTAEYSVFQSKKTRSSEPLLAKCNSTVIKPQLQSTGTGPHGDCVDRLQTCYVNCSMTYPDSPGNLNALYRQECEDSCDASYGLCTSIQAVGTGFAGWAYSRVQALADGASYNVLR